LALDLPGHGRSGGTEGLVSVAAYAEFLSSFVEALDLRPFVIVGKGMGASIALHYGASRAKRLRGVVLLGGAANPEVPQATLAVWRDVMRGRVPQPFTQEAFSPATPFDVMRTFWSEQVKTDPRVRYQDLVAWSADDFRERLSEVRPPVLVVAGADDRVVSPETSQELCPQLPNARLEVIEAAGHVAELEKPEELAARIDDFVRSLEPEEKRR
jgi:pimeloyl-ACP methyl ester carboxylesterase